jgi:DNA-binding transcriptional MerR regulator
MTIPPSLYQFVLTLKGRGFFLSPKEVKFLKKLLDQGFTEEEIKKRLEECFKKVLPLKDREKSSLLRCIGLFLKKDRRYRPRKIDPQAYPEINWKPIREKLNKLSPSERKQYIEEAKQILEESQIPPTEENILQVLIVLLTDDD